MTDLVQRLRNPKVQRKILWMLWLSQNPLPSVDRGDIRSVTPMGFARAVFYANTEK